MPPTRRCRFSKEPWLNVKALDALLADGVTQNVFPLCRAVVVHKGQRVYEGGNASADTVFDLASLTKVVGTTAVTLRLVEQGKLVLTAPVREFFPAVRLEPTATLEDLLYHRAGYPPFLCYFEAAMREHPQLFAANCPPALRAQTRREVWARVLDTAPTYARGAQAIYSDIGLIVLGEVCAQVSGQPLDNLFEVEVARPLALSTGYRRLSAPIADARPLAPTGATRPREHAPGQETMWSLPFHPSRVGEVDDDNAWCLDGVSGHAGLFGTAADVATFGQAVLDGFIRPPSSWNRDASTPGSTRSLGFDTPSVEAPSCGVIFGNQSPGAIGHLGFTGTSLWLDRARGLVVALLTNRTALGRANVRIRDFRPRFHDAVIHSLKL